ncbi:MAG: hypothetical protein QMC36_03415 [Patescibacteria group bacterium]
MAVTVPFEQLTVKLAESVPFAGGVQKAYVPPLVSVSPCPSVPVEASA